MSFHEVRFPDSIAYGATGGPVWSTNVAAVSSGIEQRNQKWTAARHSYNVETGIKTLAHFSQVLAFFHARRGRLFGFRFKDWGDYSTAVSPEIAITANDQAIGTYTGAPLQIAKLYGDAEGSYMRTLRKIVAGTARVAVSGTETLSSGYYPWSVDLNTGLLSFTGSGLTLPTGLAITVGCEFDVPVRFDTDSLSGTYEGWRRLPIRNISIIELRF
ncbi:glycoside hydrolase family 24 [Siccirubricoccus deserti]|uniref:DUF2460 domain-containing protein n=1 Tax=Siccirubricoccus deserti TaxID=2013562 RepID=A0A9X0R500_9PROT|nr:DUF2460 domain-containing protein [Siccirubricoccus deserti]MBC4019020.1 DUF2460 domain-containing protein [Siccirubricoccus deserti]GGC70254.1 glycoside hydrolase family 24 [Siccirubricoccus deserti]